MRLRAALVALLLTAAPPAAAEAPQFRLPVDCRLGETCWIINYPDSDPGPQARDYACRPRSYDGHDGTDIAVRDKAQLARGIPVRAAAAGNVVQTRDGEPEGLWMAGREDLVKAGGKQCGNRVAIRHPDGWVTDYCHLRKGSVAVKVGDKVAAGQTIGQMGLSGMTAFPHAHMGVLHFDPGQTKGVPVDPFTGLELSKGCGSTGRDMWIDKVAYEPMALYAAGLSDHVPSDDSIKEDAGSPAALPRHSPVIAVWAAAWGVMPGDRMNFTLESPEGRILINQTFTIDRTQAWRYAAIGSKRPGDVWPAGTYRGIVHLERNGLAPQTRRVTVELR